MNIPVKRATFEDFAYVIPYERFIYRLSGRWAYQELVGKDGITAYLMSHGWSLDEATALLKQRTYTRVYGFELLPNEGAFAQLPDGKLVINTWVPPTLVPKPGAYPHLQRVFEWLTNGDAEGERWLKQWMARKVQNPALVPKVAVVITTQPGGGKGTLAYCMAQMLGPENCETVKPEHLGNRFNSRWAGKLFVLADEILSQEGAKDTSNSLKVYIDGPTIELEGKGKDQRTIRNRLAWMFASNDPVSPVVVESHDRRYTVFSNHAPLPDDYRLDFITKLFPNDRASSLVKDEIAALYHELLHTEVDTTFVGRPLNNAARRGLISASMPSDLMFFKAVEEEGLDELLAEWLELRGFDHKQRRKEWDLGESGISTQIFYALYQDFCKRAGVYPVRINKFGQSIQGHRPSWTQGRPAIPGTTRRVNVYRVPRTQVQSTTPTPTPNGTTQPPAEA